MSQDAYEITVEKSASFLLVCFLMLILDWRSIIALFVVLGQGHFLLAYYYQFKAGKMDRAYLARYLVSSALLLIFWFSSFHHELLVLFTAVFFLQHALFDELYLLRDTKPEQESPLNWGRLLEISPVFLLYTGMLVDGILSQPTSPQTLWLSARLPPVVSVMALLSALLLGFYTLALWKKSHRLDSVSLYFFVCGFLLMLVIGSGLTHGVPVVKLMGFIILFHYFNWYGHYYHKLQSEQLAMRHYLGMTMVINLAIVGLYLLWTRGALGFLGTVFLSEDAFYLWTILHLVTSLRKQDFSLGWSA